MLLYHNVHLDVDPGENVCPAERALFQVQAAVVAATEMSTWQQDDAALQTRGFYHSKLLNSFMKILLEKSCFPSQDKEIFL